MALEQIRKNEDELRSMMQLYGRGGLWNDWQKFQAEARKSRQVEEKLAAKKRQELIEGLVGAHLSLWDWLLLVGCFTGGCFIEA